MNCHSWLLIEGQQIDGLQNFNLKVSNVISIIDFQIQGFIQLYDYL